MKKLTIFVSLLMIILLAGCSSNARKTVVDNPADEIATALKLSDVKNGVSINPELDKTKGTYYDVKIAANPSSTLIYDVITLDDYFNSHFKGLNLKVLYFNQNMYSSDMSGFLAELNNEDYGLSDSKIGKTFVTDSTSKTLYGNINVKMDVAIPDDYDTESTKENVLVVAYLPVYCVYCENNQDYSKVYMLVPVFYSLTYMTDSIIENNSFDGITKYTIVLNDKGLLPSSEA